jgi:hypothetical protein
VVSLVSAWAHRVPVSHHAATGATVTPPPIDTGDPPMSLIGLVLTLIVVGVLLWLVNKYIPMDDMIKKIINILVVIVVVLWLLQVFGLLDLARNIQIQKLR